MIYRNSKKINAIYNCGKNIIRVMHNGKCVYNACETVAGTVPITINTSAEFINQYQIWGNVQQNGTPEPENPVEVFGVGNKTDYGYEIPVVNRGKNLVDFKTVYVGNRFEQNGDFVTAYGTYFHEQKIRLKDLGLLIGERFTFSAIIKNHTTVATGMACANINRKNIIGFYSGVTEPYCSSITATVQTDNDYIYISYGDSGKITASDIQLELGDTATEYEPYREPVRTSIFLDKPLFKGDYISKDKSGGKVYRAWGVKVFDGTEIWTNPWGTSLFSIEYAFDHTPFLKAKAFCTHYIYNSIKSGIDKNTQHGEFVLQLFKYSIHFKDTRFTTPTDFKSFLATEYAKGTPVTVYYLLEIPTEEPIELPDIPTVAGYNVIDVDTDVKPEKISLTYRR